MAALGTNMGKKPDKKQAKADKPKKKMADKVEDAPKKVGKIKPTVKKQKVSAKSSAPVKKMTKAKTAKKVVVVKSSPLKKQQKTVSVKKSSKDVVEQGSKSAKLSPTPKKLSVKAPRINKEVKPLRNAKLILEPSKRKKIRKTKVILEGDLNINNVDAFMSQIEPIFDDYDYVDFFQREVTSLDLCHIQMLYYFKNHPTRKGKTVTINSELSTDLKKLATNAGFKEFMFIPKLV